MKPTGFLAGKKWAEGVFATKEELTRTFDWLKKADPTKDLSIDQANMIEASINSLALSIIRFSNSEWCNDYYWTVESLHEITTFLDAYNKHHKAGKYFSL